MVCKEIRKKLKPFMDGELVPEEAASIHDHVRSCEGCRTEVESLHVMDDLLEAYPEAQVPPWFSQRVMARARDTEKESGSILSVLWRWWTRPLAWTNALVFCAGILLGGTIFQAWSGQLQNRLITIQTEQESYSLGAFQDFPPESIVEGYWEMLPIEEDEDSV